jgi:hypothetical protein
MIKKIALAIVCFTVATNIYADDPASVQEGAQNYDWDTCVSNKANGCLNNCTTSPDINCKDNCNDLAEDKCRSLGLTPPQ